MNILVVNGPNLNFLGKREKSIYGDKSYSDLVNYLGDYAEQKNINIEIFQTNHEGEIIDIIQNNFERFSGLIINPGAYTHYSYAIYDCLLSIDIKKVEVHLSDIYKREDFRKISVTGKACEKQIYGKGFLSYIEAIDYLISEVNK
ncbi:MAG: type II 3-dehydroquinate dehydratase [Candidatus Izemoplasmatales bacterium]|jgi:3-dehydroquinate dehydratase-2|nr:type II 3-dehydroquinate dehydratase [Candidatus Izemoplasmatales bacterium]